MPSDEWKRWRPTSDEWLQRAKAILGLLIESPEPTNKYTICKRLKQIASWPTIFYTVDDLERLGMITAVKRIDNPRGPESKLYGITKLGLAYLLSRLEPEDEDRELLDKAAERYADLLPETFKVWHVLASAKADYEQVLFQIAMSRYDFDNLFAYPKVRQRMSFDRWFADRMLDIPDQAIIRDNPMLREMSVKNVMQRVHQAIEEANRELTLLGAEQAEITWIGERRKKKRR